MSTLTEALHDANAQDQVIDDCVELVDKEVQKKKGMSGMMIKTGYKAVKGIKPGFIRKVVRSLLPDWAAKLDPLWSEAVASGAPQQHFERKRSDIAEALLSVTDEKSREAKNGVVRTTYDKLRPTAKKHVEEAVPALGALLERHLERTSA